MRLPTGQACGACGAASSITRLIRTRNHCRKCGARFEYTLRYYVLIFFCAMMGSYGGKLVQVMFDTDGFFMTAAILLPILWALVTAVWYLVPGLVVAKPDSHDGET